jgi:hypothetical protein
MKLILHLIVFAAGAGLGVWWGVNHPSEAQNVAAREEAAAAQAKIEVITHFMSSDDKNSAEYKQMLQDEQQKLQDAKAKLGN